MNAFSITRYIADNFGLVEMSNSYGYTFFFYRTDHTLPFATLISSDTEYDRVSNLDRPDVYRLNIGISKETFQTLFGTGPINTSSYDYTALNIIMPHPEYASQSFVCVLNPTGATLNRVQRLLAEAYDIAVKRFNRRNPR